MRGVPRTGLALLAATAVAVAVLAAGGARAQEDLVPAKGVVDIQVDVQPTRVVVGQPVTLTFTLAYPEGTRAYFPENPAVSPFVPAGQRRTSQGVLGQGTSETHVLELLPVRPGKAVVGPLEVAYVGPDGEAGIAQTPRIELDVGTTLGDEAAPELASPGTPVPVRVRNDPLMWTLGALGVAIVAAGLGILGYRRWRKWRDARRPAPPPIPAHERALAALADLELLGLGRDGDWRELALRVSEVVREFLGARLGFNGVEATSWEVVREIRGRDLGRMTPERIEDLLSLCDLIKFAKFQPSDAEGQALVPRAREMVLGVMAGAGTGAGAGAGTGAGTGSGTGRRRVRVGARVRVRRRFAAARLTP